MDLTVDADFGAAAAHAAAVAIDGKRPRVFGAVPQGEWLQRMGIVARLEALLALDDITETQVDHLLTACERLVDPEQMGLRYRVLAVVDDVDDESRAPAGYAVEDSVSVPAEEPVGFDRGS